MIIDRDVPIPMDDGVVLRADVFRPDEDGNSGSPQKNPVIMALGPYAKGLPYSVGFKPQWEWFISTYPNILPGSTRECKLSAYRSTSFPCTLSILPTPLRSSWIDLELRGLKFIALE